MCRHSRDMLMYHRSLAFRKEPHHAVRPPQHCQHTPLPDTPGMSQSQDCDAYEADSFIASEEGTTKIPRGFILLPQFHQFRPYSVVPDDTRPQQICHYMSTRMVCEACVNDLSNG